MSQRAGGGRAGLGSTPRLTRHRPLPLSVHLSFGPQAVGAGRAAEAAVAPGRLPGANAALPDASGPFGPPPRTPAPYLGHHLPPPALHAVPAARAARARPAADLARITPAAAACTSVSVWFLGAWVEAEGGDSRGWVMCSLAQRSWHLGLSGCKAFQAVLGFGEAAPGSSWQSPRLAQEPGAPSSGTRDLG